jgi:hypothetical protein
MISVPPWGFLLSRIATRVGRCATSTQLLLPPADRVLLRQRAADRSAGEVKFMGARSPGLLVEEGCGLVGGEGDSLEFGKFAPVAV